MVTNPYGAVRESMWEDTNFKGPVRVSLKKKKKKASIVYGSYSGEGL